MELGEESGFVTIVVSFPVPAEISGVPAVGEDGGEGVFARAEHVGDIIGVVVDAFFIMCPAWGEVIVSDALTVYMELIDAECGGVYCGAFDGLIECESFSEAAGGWQLGVYGFVVPDLYFRQGLSRGIESNPFGLEVGFFEQRH